MKLCFEGKTFFPHSFLFRIISAAITPGTQPSNVRIKTIKKLPHPLSTTEKGGKITANNTRRQDIDILFKLLKYFVSLYFSLDKLITKHREGDDN